MKLVPGGGGGGGNDTCDHGLSRRPLRVRHTMVPDTMVEVDGTKIFFLPRPICYTRAALVLLPSNNSDP